jgi:hypothetical protein
VSIYAKYRVHHIPSKHNNLVILGLEIFNAANPLVAQSHTYYHGIPRTYKALPIIPTALEIRYIKNIL